MSRPYLVFASPRSGSTLVSEVVGYYLNQKYGHTDRGEVFHHHVRQRLTGLSSASLPRLSDVHLRNHSRLKRIKVAPKPSFFKVMAHQLSFKDISYLADKYHWIYVERQNLFEQVLSYLIAAQTGQWEKRSLEKIGLIKEQPNQVVSKHSNSKKLLFESNHFESVVNQILYYARYKNIGPKGVIISFEEIERMSDPAELLLRIGFPDKSCRQFAPRHWPLSRQNKGNKLTRFEKPCEIISAYQHSFLQSLCPIDPKGKLAAKFSTPFSGSARGAQVPL